MISDDDLKAAIESELDDLADDAILRGEGTQPGWQPSIDSLAVINICVRIQEETGVVISEECVPVGGFQDRDTCISTMLAHAKKALAAASVSKEEAN